MYRISKTIAFLGILGVAVATGCGPERPSSQTGSGGTLVLPLVAKAPSGAVYELYQGRFVVQGPVVVRLNTEQHNPQATQLSADVPAGYYQVTLLEGWTLLRSDEQGRNAVDAQLVSPNQLNVDISKETRVNATYRFVVQDEPVVMGSGIDIDIEVVEQGQTPDMARCEFGYGSSSDDLTYVGFYAGSSEQGCLQEANGRYLTGDGKWTCGQRIGSQEIRYQALRWNNTVIWQQLCDK